MIFNFKNMYFITMLYSVPNFVWKIYSIYFNVIIHRFKILYLHIFYDIEKII